MTDYIVNGSDLTSVANAIRAKAGTSEILVFPSGFVSEIENIPSGGGGGSVVSNAVNFRDYDGTIVYSYSASDFAALTTLPENPSHEGLTAQGWNWTLARAKAYVAKYGQLDIGQMYITDDGKTRVYIHLEKGRTSPMLGVYLNGTVDVDWGDGTEHGTLTGTSISTVKWTSTHNYAAPGDYVIKLTVTGSMEFYGASSTNQRSGLLRYASGNDARNRVYNNVIQKVEVGSGVTSIGQYVFSSCYSLASISIPDGVTSIGQSAFDSCYSLASISIPDGVTSIEQYVFNSCYSLASISIPDGVTSIGTNALSGCYSLVSISIPDGVTSIGQYVFSSCYSLASISMPDGVTSIGQYAFNSCSSLASISIPDGATSIGTNAFSSCYSLASISIPDGVTSIGNNAFSSCSSLASISIPDGVTSIGNNVFSGCAGIFEYHFAHITPPTLSNSNAFYAISADCVIYVPYSEDHSILEAYKSATNWSTYASYMREEEA